MLHKLLPTVLITASIGCTLAALVALWRNVVAAHSLQDELFAPRFVDHATEFTRLGHVRGPMVARDTVLVFSDIQCPYCREFAATLDSLSARHHSLRIIERHYPLVSVHPQALTAAYFAECAGETLPYPKVRAALFHHQPAIAQNDWRSIEVELGIRDTAALHACMSSRRFAPAIAADVAAGNALGISGTPGVIVDDLLLLGTPTLTRLETVLAQHRAH